MLVDLMAADGVGGPADEPAWRDFVEHVVEVLDVGPGTTVFDVGCGAGAFLFPLWENGYRVGGVDADALRLARARAAMPQGRFVVGPPSEVDPAEAWDVVVASAGLARCEDVDRARGLVARMVAKATHGIAVLQVVDSSAGGALALDRGRLLRVLVENGVTAVQFEEASAGRYHAFGRV